MLSLCAVLAPGRRRLRLEGILLRIALRKVWRSTAAFHGVTMASISFGLSQPPSMAAAREA